MAEIKTSSSRGSWPKLLKTARETEPFDPSLFELDEPDVPGVDYGDCERYEGEDPETIEKMQQDDIRDCTRDLLLVERAKEWLLGGRRIIMARKKELPPSAEISDELLSKFKAIMILTDAFCKRHLNEEYVKMCRRLALALARKRPTPIARGRAEVWACGIVRTIGWANMLDDPKQISLHETDRHRSQIWRSQ